MPIDVVTLSEAQRYADFTKQEKPKEVRSYSDNRLFPLDNTEYVLYDVNSLDITTIGEGSAHIMLQTGSAPNISFTGYSGIAGDDITSASSDETWEISLYNETAICINWGVLV